jgi:hypothetical protein
MIDVHRDPRRRVLFVGEAVTLAHVARPIALAAKLVARGYRPIVAADPRFAALCPPAGWDTTEIRSIPSADFLLALARGKPVYDPRDARALCRGRSRAAERRPAGGGDRRLPHLARGERAPGPRAVHQPRQRLLEPVREAALAGADDALVAFSPGRARRRRVSAPRGRWRFAFTPGRCRRWRASMAWPRPATSFAMSTPTAT